MGGGGDGGEGEGGGEGAQLTSPVEPVSVQRDVVSSHLVRVRCGLRP